MAVAHAAVDGLESRGVLKAAVFSKAAGFCGAQHQDSLRQPYTPPCCGGLDSDVVRRGLSLTD